MLLAFLGAAALQPDEHYLPRNAVRAITGRGRALPSGWYCERLVWRHARLVA